MGDPLYCVYCGRCMDDEPCDDTVEHPREVVIGGSDADRVLAALRMPAMNFCEVSGHLASKCRCEFCVPVPLPVMGK